MTDEEAIKHLETNGNYKVIKRLGDIVDYHTADDTPKLKGVILDVETTGLDKDNDKIIELGLIAFEFNKEGKLYSICESHDFYEDPGVPIPEEITKLTGIRDEDVKGKKIDDGVIADILSDVVLVIAHNANFDRPFCEKRFPIFKDLHWACTLNQIPWKEERIAGRKQEYIAYAFNFFYEAHRADSDCKALLHILNQTLPESKQPVFKTLLEAARKPTFKVSAVGAPFDKKDLLKNIIVPKKEELRYLPSWQKILLL